MQSHCVLKKPRMLSHASPVVRSRPARAVPCHSATQQKQQSTSSTSAPAKQTTQADAKPQQQRPQVVQQHVPLSQQQQDAILPQPSRNSPTTDSNSLNLPESYAGDYALPAEMSLWDADGDHYSSRRDLQQAYQAPQSDLPGAAVALSLIVCWVRSKGVLSTARQSYSKFQCAHTASLQLAVAWQLCSAAQGAPDKALHMGADLCACCVSAARLQSAMFQHAIWGYDMFAPFSIPHLLDGVFSFAALEFLSAGLFITTREHGC